MEQPNEQPVIPNYTFNEACQLVRDSVTNKKTDTLDTLHKEKNLFTFKSDQRLDWNIAAQLASEGNEKAVQLLLKYEHPYRTSYSIVYGYALNKHHKLLDQFVAAQRIDPELVLLHCAIAGDDEYVGKYLKICRLSRFSEKIHLKGYAMGGHHDKVNAILRSSSESETDHYLAAKSYLIVGNFVKANECVMKVISYFQRTNYGILQLTQGLQEGGHKQSKETIIRAVAHFQSPLIRRQLVEAGAYNNVIDDIKSVFQGSWTSYLLCHTETFALSMKSQSIKADEARIWAFQQQLLIALTLLMHEQLMPADVAVMILTHVTGLSYVQTNALSIWKTTPQLLFGPASAVSRNAAYEHSQQRFLLKDNPLAQCLLDSMVAIAHSLTQKTLLPTELECSLQQETLKHFVRIISQLGNGQIKNKNELVKQLQSFSIPKAVSLQHKIAISFYSQTPVDATAAYRKQLKEVTDLLQQSLFNVKDDSLSQIGTFLVRLVSQVATNKKGNTKALTSLLPQVCEDISEETTNTNNGSSWF